MPAWRLPPGVPPGVWDYANVDHIAHGYDHYFEYNRLFQFDEALLAEHFREPGTLIDLGCGTGRLLIPFARRGFRVIGVDLSMAMLRVAGEKAVAEKISIDRVRANMVELGCFADRSCDYCICMFSSLGMISRSANRKRVLDEARRILKPGGRFAIHVHNRWFNLFDPQGRRWLLSGLLPKALRGGLERGDKVFEYLGVPNLRLHVFTKGEFVGLLRDAGFQIRRLIPLDTMRQEPLAHPWWLGRLRANGWIAICD